MKTLINGQYKRAIPPSAEIVNEQEEHEVAAFLRKGYNKSKKWDEYLITQSSPAHIPFYQTNIIRRRPVASTSTRIRSLD
jgi:hypothetical protein